MKQTAEILKNMNLESQPVLSTTPQSIDLEIDYCNLIPFLSEFVDKYQDIALSPSDIFEAIQFKKNKIAYGRRLNQNYKEPNWKAEKYLEIAIQRFQAAIFPKQIDFNSEEPHVVELFDFFAILSFYFALDDRFCEYVQYKNEEDGTYKYLLDEFPSNPSLSKGIGLFGATGVGKTTIMMCFSQNPQNPFGKISVQDHSEGIKDSKDSQTHRQFNVLQKSQSIKDFYGHDQIGTLFDDLGAEDFAYGKSPFQGTLMNILESIDSGSRPPRSTHFTTNNPLNTVEIEIEGRLKIYKGLNDIYAGGREISRVKQYFNLMKVPKIISDFRHKNNLLSK